MIDLFEFNTLVMCRAWFNIIHCPEAEIRGSEAHPQLLLPTHHCILTTQISFIVHRMSDIILPMPRIPTSSPPSSPAQPPSVSNRIHNSRSPIAADIDTANILLTSRTSPQTNQTGSCEGITVNLVTRRVEVYTVNSNRVLSLK